MKKRSFLLLVPSILLASCAPQNIDGEYKEADENEVCSLNFTVYDNATAYRKLAQQFNTIHPNWTINVREMSAGYFDNLKTYFGANMAPDLFYMEGGEIAPFVRDNQLLNLTPYLEHSTDLKEEDLWSANNGYKYNSDTGQFGDPNGKLYAVAKDLSADFVMVYNKSHIDEYNNSHTTSLKDLIGYPSDDGVYPSETTPMTWAQNEEFCFRLTKKEGDIFQRYGTVFDYTPWRHVMEWVQQQGSSLFSEDGKTFNGSDPKVIDAFKHLLNYCYGDKISSTPLDTASVDTGNGFKSGSVSVVWTGRWAFKAYNWDQCDFEIGLAPGPVKNVGDTVYASTGHVGIAASATCKYPGVAFKFIEYILTSGVRQQIRNNEAFNVPGNKTIASSDAYLNCDDTNEKKLNNYFYNLTNIAEPFKFSPYINTTLLETKLATPIGHTWDDTQGHLSVENALLQAKTAIETEIQKVIRRL